MEMQERCLRLSSYIQTLTGIHTTLLDVWEKQFLLPPFRSNCPSEPLGCAAHITHLYGAYEAERWGGKYIYYCPRGLAFLAVTPKAANTPLEYCIVIGPVIMSNDDDPFEDVCGDPTSLSAVPRLTTAQVHALSELVSMATASFSIELLPPDVDSDTQAELLQAMYDLALEVKPTIYPISDEHQLMDCITKGNKSEAHRILNELLAHIYIQGKSDLDWIRARVWELLVLMSRAAIGGGADVNEIFDLCQRYRLEVDSLHGIESLNKWIGAILHKFSSFVFDFNGIKHQNVIYKINAYIKDHLSEKISLDQAAEHVFLSKSYFCRIIKDDLGCTFTEHVNQLRVERSKTLLANTDLSIAEIACAVGFDDQSYFTRVFKQQSGNTPGKYRNRYRRKRQEPVHITNE